MPTYEYACAKCGHQFEVVQSFSDAPISICPECGGEVKKIYSNIGVVFKGAGFYKNDSRKESKKVETPKTETKKPESKPTTQPS